MESTTQTFSEILHSELAAQEFQNFLTNKKSQETELIKIQQEWSKFNQELDQALTTIDHLLQKLEKVQKQYSQNYIGTVLYNLKSSQGPESTEYIALLQERDNMRQQNEELNNKAKNYYPDEWTKLKTGVNTRRFLETQQTAENLENFIGDILEEIKTEIFKTAIPELNNLSSTIPAKIRAVETKANKLKDLLK